MKKNFLQTAVFLGILFLAIFFIRPLSVSATGLPEYLRPGNLATIEQREGTGEATRQATVLIGKIINWIFGIVGLIAVWAVLNNAFWLVVAVGKGETIDQRKKALFWAAGGLVLLILSYAIIQLVVEFIISVAQEAPAGPAMPEPAP